MRHEQIRLHRAWPERIQEMALHDAECHDARMASPAAWAGLEQVELLGHEQAATAENSPCATQLDMSLLAMHLHERKLQQMVPHEQRLKQTEVTPPDQLELLLGATRGGQEGAAWVHEQVQLST